MISIKNFFGSAKVGEMIGIKKKKRFQSSNHATFSFHDFIDSTIFPLADDLDNKINDIFYNTTKGWVNINFIFFL
jgi:hypothetical protein